MVPATSGLSLLRDFHSIKFRPADIPVWLDASRERLLRAPRPLRLRLRCQREKRCRSKVRHKCRPYHRPGSLASGGQDCGRCPLRVQVPQTCFRLPHCLGRIAACGYAHPPGDAGYGDFVTFAKAVLPVAGRLPAGAGHRAAVVVLRIHCGSYEDSVGCHQSERRWLLDGLTPIGVPLPYIKTTERSLSIYSIGAIEDLETFDYSRLRRNFASVICEGQCKAFVVGHSLRPTASVQCEGDKAVSFGRKAAQRASFPPCWVYHAHQCRRSRHRRAHSCCRS